MSLRNLPYSKNSLTLESFVANNSFTIKENINSIIHKVDETTGEYIIKNASDNNILSVDKNGNLTNTSYIKSHIANQIAPISSQVGVHQSNLDDHENRINTLETSVPTTENLTDLQNRVSELENYVVNVKAFMLDLRSRLGGDDIIELFESVL